MMRKSIVRLLLSTGKEEEFVVGDLFIVVKMN